jgi:DNA repair exonuclease SbcCD ATPase subunit
MNCPICNQSINPSSQFCENCDFEVMIISNNASLELKEYMLNRQEKFKKNYQEKLKLNDQLQNLENKLNNKINELKDAQDLIKKQELEIKQFKGKVATTQEELNRLRSYENLANAKIIEIDKLHKEIVELKKKVIDTSKFKELEVLLKELINKVAGLSNELHTEFINKYKKIR